MAADAQVYTADDLASMLGVDRKTVYTAAKLGQLPHRRLGRRVVFPKAAVDEWLAQAPSVATTAASTSGRRGRRCTAALGRPRHGSQDAVEAQRSK